MSSWREGEEGLILCFRDVPVCNIYFLMYVIAE
jgi:hypothetical protein